MFSREPEVPGSSQPGSAPWLSALTLMGVQRNETSYRQVLNPRHLTLVVTWIALYIERYIIPYVHIVPTVCERERERDRDRERETERERET
jgi:hypothetical protein